MMNTRHILCFFAALMLLSGCRELPAYFSADPVLARVGARELKRSELQKALPQGVTGEDSAAMARTTIDRWVHKQVKLQQAEEVFSASVADIDRKVEDYRQTLLIHKLDELWVDRQIDTAFTAKEIADYYNAHKADFRLDRALVKGRIVRFKEGYRQQHMLKTLMAGKSEAQQQDFSDICEKNEFTVTDFREKWVDFSEFLSYLPALRTENYDSVLASGEVQQMRDSKSHYYFQISEVGKVGDNIPLEMITPTIRRILYKQRQEAIITRAEEEIYKQALTEERVEIFADKDKTPEEEPAPKNQ